MKLSSLKVSLKKKLLSFQINFCIWVFFAGIWKKLLPFSKSVSLNFPLREDSCKNKKILTFRTKPTLFGYFRTGIWKSHCHIWYQRPRIRVFGAKQKTKFGTKNVCFAYFWGRVWKYYCHIWNLPPQICLAAKFDAKTKIMKKKFVKKTKMPKFDTKNPLFRYFGLEFENNTPYMKSALRICLIAKFRE